MIKNWPQCIPRGPNGRLCGAERTARRISAQTPLAGLRKGVAAGRPEAVSRAGESWDRGAEPVRPAIA
jgi:hypothetical protein